MQELDALPDAKQQLATVLNGHGILPTVQRVEIAAILLAHLQHLSAEQVLAKVSTAGLAVSKATIYNTLGLFVERGLVREVIVDSTRVFYDSNTAPHYHFYNVDDGTLTDVAIDDVVIARLPSPPGGTAATGVDIVMRVRNQKLQ
ncbi:MAG: transcriptional repressor [Gammaproteobacteria bacterium]|nr:transcriptional repressor [Gammaproteobacteria bacterium]